MRTFHLNISTEEEFEKIRDGKTLLYRLEDDVVEFVKNNQFKKLVIWFVKNKKPRKLIRPWNGVDCYGHVIVNERSCFNCINDMSCSGPKGNRTYKVDNRTMRCFRMDKFCPSEQL